MVSINAIYGSLSLVYLSSRVQERDEEKRERVRRMKKRGGGLMTSRLWSIR